MEPLKPVLLQPGVETPALQPLANSHDDSAFDAALKQLVMDVFEATLRPIERRVNVLGVPHLGDFELLERSIKAAGLALYRGADEGSMRYLYKAFRARNPRRGLAMLKMYMQLLFPNAWTVTQLWQDKAKTYPYGLTTTDEGNHWLTSRVRVEVTGVSDTLAVISLISAIRSVVPVRFLVTVKTTGEAGLAYLGFTAVCAGQLKSRITGTLG